MNQVSPETNEVNEVNLADLDKAAILLLSMGEENAASVIRKLGRQEVQALSQRMANISNVSQTDVAFTLNEFFDCYRNESGVSGASRIYLERALDKAVGRKLARGMLDDIYGGAMNDDIRRLEWVPPELIVRFLEQEHVQMQALFLAFLPAEQAAAIISLFPQHKHDDLLLRIGNLREVSEPVMDDIRLTLENCIEYVGKQVGAKVNGVEKVAEIVNRYNGNKAEIIDMMKRHNAGMADAIQERMYDFATLMHQTEETLVQLMDEVPDELWVLALKGSDNELLEHVMTALPKRLGQVYRQQIDSMPAQPIRKVEEAKAEIMSMVRDMMKQGTLDYRLYPEETTG